MADSTDINNYNAQNQFPEEFGNEVAEQHLWDYIHIVLQRLPLALAVFASIVILTALYTWTRTPEYQAKSRLLIERSQIDLTNINDIYDTAPVGLSQRDYIETRVKMILSRPVMEKTLQSTDLISDPTFAESRDPANKLMNMLNVNAVRNSQLIDVSIQHENPKKAATIVNSVVKAFSDENAKRRMGVSEEGLLELRKKADELRAKLDTASRKLHEFMAKNKIVSFEKAQNIVVERLRELNRNLTQFQPERIELQAKVAAADAVVNKGQSIDTLPDVIRSEVIRQLKIDLARAEQEYAQMLLRLGENHAQVRAVSAQIDTIKTKLTQEASAILTSLRTQYDQMLKEEKLLQKALSDQEEVVLRFNRLAVEYDLLARAKNSVEKAYDTIITRIEEINMNRMGGQGEDVFTISKAEIPTQKAWPEPVKNMGIGIVLALACSVGLCFFIDYMDTTIKNEPDVIKILNSTVLGGIPDVSTEIENNKNLPILATLDSKNEFAESLRNIRTAISFNSPDRNPRSLIVTSTLKSEGKSLVSANLAVAYTQTGKRTLLVDADMRRPSLARNLNIKTDKGLSNLLAGKDDDINSMAVSTNVENLFLLPSGPVPPNPVELLDTERFAQVVKLAESNFDVVIFDTPPSASMVDALVMSRHVKTVILVARSFTSPKSAAQKVVETFRHHGPALTGVVLNNLDVPKHRYYHPYYYGYYSKYDDYYHAPEKKKKLMSRKS